jgi:hypothetical protein
LLKAGFILKTQQKSSLNKYNEGKLKRLLLDKGFWRKKNWVKAF